MRTGGATGAAHGNRGPHGGRGGRRIRRIPFGSGSSPPFRLLHAMQLQTMFSHVVFPPRERGITWSRFNSFVGNTFPQYWHAFLSRPKILRRQNRTLLRGTPAYG